MGLSSAWRDIERMDLSNPSGGKALNAEQFGYTEKRSADNQAELWNAILKGHPKYAPAVCGHKVGVADKKQDQHYPLVWAAQKQSDHQGRSSDGPTAVDTGSVDES